ncbi:MAG: tyrosine-protein phosphatase [Clostridia bacterium]|nr:tyrosine-protein phosphatase [Clostridia bacterium]
MTYRIQNIPFAKLINTRDLGGLPTKDGRTIRPKAFLRAASLYQLVPSDGEKLVDEYKVAFDIDLRIEKELARQPDAPLPGVQYRHFRLREDVMEGFERKTGETIGKMVSRIPGMPQLYLNMVTKEDSLNALRGVFRLFFDEVVPGEKAALFHCSEGKDRTGIVAALLEDLVGVPRELIWEDYILSNAAFEKRNRRYYLGTRLIMKKATADAFKDMYHANTDMLKGMFAYLDDTYGGTEGFFTEALGFRPDEIEQFKNKVLQ